MQFLKNKRILVLLVLSFLFLSFSKESLAEDIILNDLNGKAVNLSSYKGKPLILFFWTTWCPYCRKEIKALNQMYIQMKQEGITVFAVDIGESSYAVQKFLKNNTLDFGVLLDQDGALANNYNVMGVPAYVFMDKSGKINSEHSLPVDYKKLLFK